MPSSRCPGLIGPWSRRHFLQASALGAGALAAGRPGRLLAADKITVVNSIRSLTNPYHATWNKGGEAFAKSVGADYVTLVTEGNSEKGIADIKAILAKTGGNCVINVDPNDSPDARPIVEACKAAGAYVVTQWNKPADLHPWDFDPELRRPHLVQRRALRQGDGRGADQGDGRQGRHRGARRHRVQRARDRAQGRPRRGARSQPGRQAARLPGRQLVGQPRRSTRPTPGSPSSATRSAASGRPTTTWRSPRSRRCAPTAGRQGAGHRHRRHPARGRGDPERRDGRHGRLGPVLAGRHGPLDRLPRQDRQVRSVEGAERSSRVLRHRRHHHRGQRQGVLRENIKSEPKLDWNDIWGRATGRSSTS